MQHMSGAGKLLDEFFELLLAVLVLQMAVLVPASATLGTANWSGRTRAPRPSSRTVRTVFRPRNPPMPPLEADPSANTRVLNTASGSSPSFLMRLIQSSVFFNRGVMDALYSGQAMRTPE